MNITNLIDLLHTTGSTGEITIPPMTSIKKNFTSFEDTKIWDSESIYSKKSKEVKFGDNIWQPVTDKHTSISLLPGESEIAFQIRAFALLKMFIGDYEGDSGAKSSTTHGYVLKMKTLGKFMLKKGYSSFHQFCNDHPVKIHTAAHDFFTDDLRAETEYPDKIWFDSIFNPDKNYGLLSEAACDIFNSVGIDFRARFHKDRNSNVSHPVIPTRILKQLIQWATSVVNEAIDNIDEFEEMNLQIIDDLVGYKPIQKSSNKRPASTLVRDRIRISVGEKKFNKINDKFKDLKQATLVLILAFTGMRIEEALSLKIGSAKEVDDVYNIVATMTKTDDTKLDLPWIANKDAYDAVSVLSRAASCMAERAKILIKHHSTVIQEQNIHNFKVGVDENKLFGSKLARSPSFTLSGDFSNLKPDSHTIFDIKVTSEDIEQLNKTESNSKSTKGINRGLPYEVGDIFNLTPHMFRHTFAWFIIANRLGELDDIKYQFNHLSYAMSMVYSHRGVATTEEIITIFEGFEDLLTSQVASEIAEQAEKGTLGGGGGERFNKTAKNMVIGITDTNSDNPTEIRQIHFENLDRFELFLQKNLLNIRGLPHGFCSGDEACKVKNAAVPTGCVYCGTYTVVERQMVHWTAMRNYATAKLAMYDDMDEDDQRRYELMATQWRDSVSAADTVMVNFNKANAEKAKTKVVNL